jgi:signal transduction histidine kinase/ActR/RegA family two-component response regulator
MSLSNRRIGIRYGLAIVSVAVVALLRWSLQPALADAAPLILFVLPIMAAGWYGGIGPALLATLLGTLTGAYLFLPAARAHHQLQWNDLPGALAFFTVGIALSISHDISYRMCRRLTLRTAEARRRQQLARRTQDKLTRVIDSTSDVEQAQRELEEANRAKDQFLAVLSHELRTPLTPVLATVTAMEEDPTIPADARASLRIVRRNVELEARLIDDLLDLTRVNRGKLHMVSEVVAVHDLVRTAIETACQEDARAKQLKLVLALEAEHDEVWGDPVRLQQVIWNLLRNAVKFTPPQGRIEVRSKNVDQLLRVEFIDNGMGIDGNSLPKIFNAFEQADEAIKRRFGGLGLGLAISKGLVEAQGGRLSADSDGLGKGSKFTLEMVLAEAQVRQKPKSSGTRFENGPGPLRILLVEDHEDTARIMSKLLRSFDHRVTLAGNFATAIEAVEAEHFDLLISDLGLPDGNGRDLMRQAQKKHSIRGIALSGYGMESDVKASLEAGFAEHLTKPVNIIQLQEAIRRVTNGDGAAK